MTIRKCFISNQF